MTINSGDPVHEANHIQNAIEELKMVHSYHPRLSRIRTIIMLLEGVAAEEKVIEVTNSKVHDQGPII